MLGHDVPSFLSRHRTRAALIPALLAVLLLALAAAASARTAPGAAGCPGLAHASQQLESYKKIPQFTAPGPALDVSKLRGKKLFVIPALSTIPFNRIIDDNLVKVGNRVGVKVQLFQNQGQNSQWVAGFNQAIAQHVDAIILGDIDPRLLVPQMAAAKRAHIAVVIHSLYDQTDTRDRVSTPAAVIESPFSFSARLEADDAIVKTSCKADVVAVQSAEYLNFKYEVGGMLDEFKRYCPSCKVKVVNVPAVDWATKIQSSLQSAFLADPGVNWAIPLVDAMTQYALPAVVATSRVGKIRMSTFNGTPFVLKDIRESNVVSTDAGENLGWKAWATLDQTFRVLLGMPPVKENTPIRVFDKSNVAEAGNPPTFDEGYGTAYISGYLKLWGAK